MINPTQSDLDTFVYQKLREQINNSQNNGHSPYVNDALTGKYRLVYYRGKLCEIKVFIHIESESKEVGVCVFNDSEFDTWLRETKINRLIN